MKRKLMIAGAAFCAALFLFSGIMLFREYHDRQQSAQAFEQVAGLVLEDSKPEEPQDKEANEPEMTAFEKYAEVLTQNDDLIGWISVPGTRIDYPVMQTKDNPNFYLKYAFYKSYSNYGVPYAAENCDADISDNMVLYGHHMNDGSMFSDLCKYADENFYREHKTIRFDMLSGFGEYEVIAVFQTVAYSEQGFKYYHFVNAESETAFNEYISKCKELALYDTGVTAEYSDRLITLSTCEYSRQNGRMVVVAKKVVLLSAKVGENEA
jgi:sortase B